MSIDCCARNKFLIQTTKTCHHKTCQNRNKTSPFQYCLSDQPRFFFSAPKSIPKPAVNKYYGANTVILVGILGRTCQLSFVMSSLYTCDSIWQVTEVRDNYIANIIILLIIVTTAHMHSFNLRSRYMYPNSSYENYQV